MLEDKLRKIITKPVSIILLSLFAIWVAIAGNQSFICDKTQNICYSTMSGIKVGRETKISDIKNIKIDVTNKKSKHRIYKAYFPTLITNEGKVAFYPIFVDSEEKAQQDINSFISFFKSSQNKLELKNICYFDAINLSNWVNYSP